jgi:Na+/melibiose symporter-like transporter
MTGRRSSWTLAAFAAPSLPLAALGLPLVVYLPEYYVSELGLSLSVVGSAFLLVRVADIILDPILGGMMDRTRTGIGRFRPWLAAAAPVLMLAAYFLFMAKRRSALPLGLAGHLLRRLFDGCAVPHRLGGGVVTGLSAAVPRLRLVERG